MSVKGPTPASTYERARRLSNIAVWTTQLSGGDCPRMNPRTAIFCSADGRISSFRCRANAGTPRGGARGQGARAHE
jgi:hypothetical protein